MTFEEAKKLKEEIDKNVSKWDTILKTFPSNEIGLVSEEVRNTSEYAEAKRNYELHFQKLRVFNQWYVKEFKKELALERRNKRKK